MEKILSILLLLFSTSLLVGQSNPNGEFWVTGRVEVKRGMTSEFEKAAAKLKTKKYNNSQETAMTTYK